MAETTASDSLAPSSNDHFEVDAGVVFAGYPSYFCLPLSRLWVTGSGQIESVDSSCECIKPSIIRYADTSSAVVGGLRLDFIAEEHTPDTVPQPIHLAVDVTLKLSAGKIRTVTINFLHTKLAAEGEP